jgi:hypothetical protein
MPSATQTLTSVGIVLVLSAFFFVNLVPVPLKEVSCNHGTGACTESVITTSTFSARELSFFGFNTPGMPAWALSTSDLVLIFAVLSFALDAYVTIKDR